MKRSSLIITNKRQPPYKSPNISRVPRPKRHQPKVTHILFGVWFILFSFSFASCLSIEVYLALAYDNIASHQRLQLRYSHWIAILLLNCAVRTEPCYHSTRLLVIDCIAL